MVLLTSLSSCDGGERETLRDRGAACVERLTFDGCSARELAADVPLRVSVDFDTCLSGSCDRVVREGCRASRSGSVITITAEAVIESDDDGVCTLDCNTVSSDCEIPPLPAGTYEVRYGDASIPLTIPSTTAVLCVGSADTGQCCDETDDCSGMTCENNRCL